jgi:hypothetical protein
VVSVIVVIFLVFVFFCGLVGAPSGFGAWRVGWCGLAIPLVVELRLQIVASNARISEYYFEGLAVVCVGVRQHHRVAVCFEPSHQVRDRISFPINLRSLIDPVGASSCGFEGFFCAVDVSVYVLSDGFDFHFLSLCFFCVSVRRRRAAYG